MTKPTRILLGTLAYATVTFPLAFLWHLRVFAEQYDRLGAFTRAEPIVALGFVVIVFQGVLLSLAFEFHTGGATMLRRAMLLALLAGAFLWSSQVVAFAAKSTLTSLGDWLLIESAYFAVQFTLVGLALGAVYARTRNREAVRA